MAGSYDGRRPIKAALACLVGPKRWHERGQTSLDVSVPGEH